MIVVDLSHTLHRIVHANRDEVIDNPTYVAHLLFNSLLSTADKFGASKENPIILALDSKPYWRTVFYKDNKGNFDEYSDPKFDEYKGQRTKDPDIPWDKIHEIYGKMMDALKQYSDFHVIATPYAEADDVIAVLTRYFAYTKNEKVYVVSSDKDFKQLNDAPRVVIFDPMKDMFVPDLDVEFYKKLHALMGDKSDNIQAVKPRVGEKTAEKMIPTLETLLESDPAINHRYQFNRILTDFDHIPQDLQNQIIETYEDGKEKTFDGLQLMKVLGELRMPTIAAKVHKFKLMEKTMKTEKNTFHEVKEQNEAFKENTLEEFFGGEA